MAMFEGPASTNEEFHGAPPSPASPVTPTITPTEAIAPLAPAFDAQRVKQELNRLAGIIATTDRLAFLEPRVKLCQDNEQGDQAMLLSFYRLVSQALAEEIAEQKAAASHSQAALAQAKQSSAQAQMKAALEEASLAVQKVHSRTEVPSPQSSSTTSTDPEASAKLEQAEKQVERLMMDMQNMRNRQKLDIDVRVFKELEKFSLSLLPALDAFYHAMQTIGTTNDVQSVTTGVTMIYDELIASLDKAGLRRLITVGQPFDPRFHEAIGSVPTTEVPDGCIFDELQPGYALGERVVRAAMVRVARNESPPPSPSAPQEGPPVADGANSGPSEESTHQSHEETAQGHPN